MVRSAVLIGTSFGKEAPRVAETSCSTSVYVEVLKEAKYCLVPVLYVRSRIFLEILVYRIPKTDSSSSRKSVSPKNLELEKIKYREGHTDTIKNTLCSNDSG